MLWNSRTVATEEFERESGWTFKPEGACKGEVCIPLKNPPGDTLDVLAMAESLGLPMVQDESHGLIALGPESIGSRALASAQAPVLELPDVEGNLFSLDSLLGKKVLVYAWAPY